MLHNVRHMLRHLNNPTTALTELFRSDTRRQRKHQKAKRRVARLTSSVCVVGESIGRRRTGRGQPGLPYAAIALILTDDTTRRWAPKIQPDQNDVALRKPSSPKMKCLTLHDRLRLPEESWRDPAPNTNWLMFGRRHLFYWAVDEHMCMIGLTVCTIGGHTPAL